MNIEAYDLDSLRKIVRTLQKDNEALKSQLKKADIAFDGPNPFEETIESIHEYDPDQGDRIHLGVRASVLILPNARYVRV